MPGRMMRAWLIGCLLPALLVAGCLEPRDDGGPGAGDAEESVSFRTLAQGQQSAAENPARLVFEDEPAWAAFWDSHGANRMPPPDRPEVDFAASRVVAVVLEDKSNACWGGAITNATRTGGDLVVEVTTFTPSPEMFCADVITQPFHFIALDDRSTPVRFEERSAEGPPPGMGEEPSAGSSSMCVEGAEECPDAEGREVGEVPVRTLASGVEPGIRTPVREVVTDQARFEAIMESHGHDGHGHAGHAEVDFSKERVLYVLDRGHHGCERVRIASATTDGETVVVEVEAYSSSPGTMCSHDMPSPYVVAAIPLGGEVHFVDKGA